MCVCVYMHVFMNACTYKPIFVLVYVCINILYILIYVRKYLI